MTAVKNSPAHYALKPGEGSSHTALLALLPGPGEGRRVLDIGCGSGELGSILAARGYDVTGVERIPPPNAAFPVLLADLDQGLPPLKGAFDYVLCADVLEHLRDPARLLRQIHSVLTPSGRLIASLPNSGHYYFRLNVLLGRFPQHDKGLFDRTHLRFYTWRGWCDLLDAADFDIIRVRPTIPPFDLAFPSLRGGLLLRAIEMTNAGLARLRKELFAYQFVVEAFGGRLCR